MAYAMKRIGSASAFSGDSNQTIFGPPRGSAAWREWASQLVPLIQISRERGAPDFWQMLQINFARGHYESSFHFLRQSAQIAII
jgi:hypothetical protein